MSMLFVNEQGTDIAVEIMEYIGKNKVRVRSRVGFPFGANLSIPGTVVQRVMKNEKVVNRDQVKVIRNG